MNRPPAPRTAMELAFLKAAQDLANKKTPAPAPRPTGNTLTLKPKNEPRRGPA